MAASSSSRSAPKGTARRQGPNGETTGPFAFKLFTRSIAGEEAAIGAEGIVRDKVVVVGPGGEELDPKAFDVLKQATPDGATWEKRIVVREVQGDGEASADAKSEVNARVFVVKSDKPGATASGDPRVGAAMTLNSVAALVLGGTALAGGFGTVVGSVIGAVIIALIEALVYVVGIPSEWQNLSRGVAILLALMAGILVGRRARA